MMISYNPSADELVARLTSLRGNPNKVIGGIKLWWNERGRICGIAIEDFTEERRNVKNLRNSIRLGGIWKDVRVTNEDIQDVRKSLLRKLEEKEG